MSELPSGWVTVPIGEVTVEIAQREPRTDENFVYIDISSIGRETKRILTPQKMMGQDAPSRARKVVQTEDVLVSMTRPNLNAVAMVPWDLDGQIASTGFDVLRAPGLDPRWIFYLVRTTDFVQSMSELVQGALYPAVRSKDIRSFEIPLAPLNEQKCIADKLDALLARVDACRERLDRVPLILKRFRQAVLAAATSGQLTEDWQNARDNQASATIHADSGAAHELAGQSPDTRWQETLIGALLVEKPRNGYSPRAVEFETATRSLTLTATTSGRFNSAYFKYIDEPIPKDSHLWLKPGDILIQRANTLEYVGVSAIYDGPPSGYIYPDLMMKCRPNSKVLTKFLYYLLSSDNVRSYFRANATGTAGNMPKINQQIVISALVRVPSIDEQHEIVRRVEALFTFADRLESRYKTARAQVEQLTPALLAKALRGELVLQDPNDEPASVLLERIRAARVVAEEDGAKSRRRKTDKSSKAEIIVPKRKDVQPSHLSEVLTTRDPLTAEALFSASQLELNIDDSAV